MGGKNSLERISVRLPTSVRAASLDVAPYLLSRAVYELVVQATNDPEHHRVRGVAHDDVVRSKSGVSVNLQVGAVDVMAIVRLGHEVVSHCRYAARKCGTYNNHELMGTISKVPEVRVHEAGHVDPLPVRRRQFCGRSALTLKM